MQLCIEDMSWAARRKAEQTEIEIPYLVPIPKLVFGHGVSISSLRNIEKSYILASSTDTPCPVKRAFRYRNKARRILNDWHLRSSISLVMRTQ